MRNALMPLALTLALALWAAPAAALDTTDCNSLDLSYSGPAATKTCKSGDILRGGPRATIELIEASGPDMQFAVQLMRAGGQSYIERSSVEDTISPVFEEGSISGWDLAPASGGFSVKRFTVNGVIGCIGFVKHEGLAQRTSDGARKQVAGYYCALGVAKVADATIASVLGAIDD